jgi:glycerol-3-phosphate acyltransferase PlsY
MGAMDLAAAAGCAAAAGFLCGSVPFSWIAVRARRGVDLRTVGSGNPGATNAARVLGRRWFPILFSLDAAKGAAAVLAAGAIAGAAGAEPAWPRTAAALGAVLGHVFPPWLGFRGGKAVATGAGAVAALSPLAAGAGLGVFLLLAAAFRFVSLGSVGAALAAASMQTWVLARGRTEAERLPLESFLWALAGLVLLRHLPNLVRIVRGTEPRILGGGDAPGPGREGDLGKP